MDGKVELLRGIPLFAELDERGIEAVGVLARDVTAPAGRVLMVEGEPADSFYVLVDGTVRVDRGGETLRSVSSGGFIGEIALVENTARTATATCVTECRLLVVEHHEFDRLMETFPEVHRRVAAAIARRRRGTTANGIA